MSAGNVSAAELGTAVGLVIVADGGLWSDDELEIGSGLESVADGERGFDAEPGTDSELANADDAEHENHAEPVTVADPAADGQALVEAEAAVKLAYQGKQEAASGLQSPALYSGLEQYPH